MKKIISLTCFLFCLSFVSLAQNAQKTSNLKQDKTSTCKPVPPEECAAKMGITIAEYLALPKKNCAKGSTAALNKNTSSTLPIVAVSNVKKTEKKCGGTIEECAKKMGMTVEECKAKCSKSTSSLSSLASNDQE